MISTKLGFQVVIVQVLSKAIAFIKLAFSKAFHHFTKIQLFAAIQVQTITAVGVASHKAQGQAITTTLQAKRSEFSNHSFSKKYQIKNVKADKNITAGTNIFDTLSANHSISAFDKLASSSKFII
jgi:hypothetical protein